MISLMVRDYIYLISFNNTNDIYIGKTTHQNIYKRLKEHKTNYLSSVHSYVKEKLNGDWSDVCIDIIDSIDMDEDFTHLLHHPLNQNTSSGLKKYTSFFETKLDLSKYRLTYTEHFHIHNYKSDGRYNLINRKITNGYNVYEVYKFLNYN